MALVTMIVLLGADAAPRGLITNSNIVVVVVVVVVVISDWVKPFGTPR